MTRGLELVASSLLGLATLGSTGAISAIQTADISKGGYEDYRSEGCYKDSKSDRIMSERVVKKRMSAEICFEYCNDGHYTHFGTQHGDECWCAKDPWLAASGGEVSSSECDMRCKRSDDKEKCGGKDRMSVYKMLPDDRKDDKDKDKDKDDLYKSKGCYKDDKKDSLMSKKYTRKSMSAEICYYLCEDDYTHFGTQDGDECWCGNNPHLTSEVSSSECDVPCARSDTREKCGGRKRMSVYEIKDKDGKDDKDKDKDDSDDSDDSDDKDDKDKDDKGKPYESEGCYKDSSKHRIMTKRRSDRPMSAEICYDICDDGYYTYFGTQYGKECWCAKDPDLHANGGKVSSRECDMVCAGSRTGEKCGDRDRMSVYKIKGGKDKDDKDKDKDDKDDKDKDDKDKDKNYKGCYADKGSRRAMPYEKWESRHMTIKLCVDYCSDLGYKYAGAQYGKECWCGDKYDVYGKSTRCDMSCAGNRRETCGGHDALSVYAC